MRTSDASQTRYDVCTLLHTYCTLLSEKPLCIKGLRMNGIQEVSGSIPLISTKTPETEMFQVSFCVSEKTPGPPFFVERTAAPAVVFWENVFGS